MASSRHKPEIVREVKSSTLRHCRKPVNSCALKWNTETGCWPNSERRCNDIHFRHVRSNNEMLF